MNKSICINLCDMCERELKSSDYRYGVYFTLGYSHNNGRGWGSRQDLAEYSGEVCTDCYTWYQDTATEMSIQLKSRLGSRRPQVVVEE